MQLTVVSDPLAAVMRTETVAPDTAAPVTLLRTLTRATARHFCPFCLVDWSVIECTVERGAIVVVVVVVDSGVVVVVLIVVGDESTVVVVTDVVVVVAIGSPPPPKPPEPGRFSALLEASS
jgi:hypothetical protein